jgi:acyl carrier protein
MVTDMNLTALLSDVLDMDLDRINDQVGRTTCGDWTSLKHIQLMVTLEELYGISFTAQEMAAVDDVSQLRALLADKGVGSLT